MRSRTDMLGRAHREGGFTMIVTIMVMFVTGLLLLAVFTAVNGDTQLSHTNVLQKQAYFAALAGVQEFEAHLDVNSSYWTACPTLSSTVPGETKETYEVSVLAAKSDTEAKKECNSANPFLSVIESKGTLANTFRIRAIGHAGGEKRTVIANFTVAGFLSFIYFTQYEDADPSSYKGGKAECENYRAERKALGILSTCKDIVFGPGDNVNGPMHTDDGADVCGGTEFGRKSKAEAKEWDSVEMNGGAEAGSCGSGSAVYNTESGKPETGPELTAPESDGALRSYVEHTPQDNEFTGLTYLELNGGTNTIKATYWEGATKKEESLEWPKNGVIYVSEGSSGCAYTEFEQENTDNSTTEAKEQDCGSVYVKGTYSKSLTIAAATDVIINGSITPYGVSGGSAPTGTATLGLIATRFVRVYHPCSGFSNGSGSLTNPWIYAAILSTSHSFLVDNYNCGSTLGTLGVYGAIAQKFRGVVGEVGTHGYTKEYVYDERLVTDEPPYFLAPLTTGWKIFRETAPTEG